MKKFYFLLLFLITKIVTAQSNYQSGFYQVDSLFFTVHWSIGNNQQLQYSVNRFTEDSWQQYTGGIWLKDRSQELNTWEDIHYTGQPCYTYDENISRGNLNRINTVRVRIIDTVTNMVKKDSVYVIGFGEVPHHHYILFCTIDSTDVSEVFKNYENKDIKKRAWLHIMKPDGTFEISQPVEFDIAAGSSACLPNKGIAFKATKDTPINGPNSFKTSLFTKSNKEEIKKIKFRVGGSGQGNSFGINETLLRVIDYPDWNIGGVRTTVGTWYLNGSYWSLGFPQVKPDERYVTEQYRINKDSVDIISPIPFNVYFDTMYPGIQDGVSGIFVDFESETAEILGLSEVYFYPNGQDFFQSTVIIRDTDGRKRVVAGIEEGNSIYLQPILQELVKLVPDSTTDHFATIDSLIDLDSWLRYICLINYFGLTDVISNNVTIGSSYRHKPFILMEDFDWAGDVSNNWDTEIVSDNDQYDGIMHDIIRKVILKSGQCRERMILMYQDMLNTGLLPSRVGPILENIRNEVMPEYGYYNRSWGGYPNGGQDSLQQESMFQSFTNYMTNYRPDQAAQILTNRWQSDDSLCLMDRNWVNIFFDSVPENSVTLNFNTLKLDSNYSGLYFPKPELQINYSTKTDDILIKEYPDSGKIFNLKTDTTITITFVKREKIVSSAQGYFSAKEIKTYPNPTCGLVQVEMDENSTMQIVNSIGALVKTQELREGLNQIDLSNFPAGTYFLKGRSESKMYVGKIIKN